MQELYDGHFAVAYMPLNEQARSRFNEQAARDFYFKMQGTPYGYQNFLYGWIDTVRDNLPMLLPNELMPIVFSVLEKLDRKASDLIFTEGLNMRLGTQGLTIPEIAAKAADLNMTIQEVMAIPEKDGWKYSPGAVYVCSSFATAVWKAAGLFDVNFQATEVTPHDIYMLDVLETDPAKRP